jgi:hypothetical protein
VYSAIHPLIGKQVAVKVLKPELCANQASIDRFVQEAQAVNKIGHPNIVDVFSLGELSDGRAYFVMEWLRGEDLKTRLARGPMAVQDACDILDGIARALDAAHAKGIVHRDLKPDNVFLHQVESGLMMVKLLDFGIAKLVRHTPGTEKTQTGNMLGTPRYISPEQARGVQVDHRSDIYSLGVMAYEMLAGRPPFQGETAMDLVVKHLSEPPPPLGQFTKVPKSLEQCVMAMLDKDPAGRPSLQEMRAILIDPTRRMTPLTSIGLVPIVRPARRWPVLVIGLLGALAIGVGTWRLVRGMQPPAANTASVEAKVAPVHEAVVADPEPAAPGETTPAVETRGALDVRVTGAKDAVILVDGEEWGRGASIRVELDPGSHELVVKPPGRDPVTQQVEIKAGSVSTIAIVVPPEPARKPARTRTRPPRRDSKTSAKPAGDDELLAPERRK